MSRQVPAPTSDVASEGQVLAPEAPGLDTFSEVGVLDGIAQRDRRACLRRQGHPLVKDPLVALERQIGDGQALPRRQRRDDLGDYRANSRPAQRSGYRDAMMTV